MATEYNIARTGGQCIKCGKELLEQEEYMAVLTESADRFERSDWCLPCWEDPARGEIPDLFSQWRSRIPVKEVKKRLFVDDELLVNFFQRLEGADEPAKLNFRFVLTLVLMRKRILVYERAVKGEDGRETWVLRLRGSDQTHEVADPKLDESKIQEVSEQLSEILQGEL